MPFKKASIFFNYFTISGCTFNLPISDSLSFSSLPSITQSANGLKLLTFLQACFCEPLKKISPL
jgi:hypothetical protein